MLIRLCLKQIDSILFGSLDGNSNEFMRKLVMGDLHGAGKALHQCLERANFDYEKDMLIQLGDIVDGYQEVYECVEELLKIRNLISIKGNHDDWFHQYLLHEYHPVKWNYGGKATIVSYLKHAGKQGRFFKTGNGYKTALTRDDVPLTHRRFFEAMIPYYIDETEKCFLHAGFERQLPFFGQRLENYYWNRSLWTDALEWQKQGKDQEDFYSECSLKEIFIGHTPTVNWEKDKPMQALNIINLDTGAGYNGRLTIMDVETKVYWQSDPMGILYSLKEDHKIIEMPRRLK